MADGTLPDDPPFAVMPRESAKSPMRRALGGECPSFVMAGLRAGHPFELPSALRNELNADEFKLFDMIWKRTIASQMADARGRRITITIEGEGCTFQVSGKTIDFPGYLRAYVEGSDSPEAELADQETVLPSVTVGEPLKCLNMTAKEHATQPPG